MQFDNAFVNTLNKSIPRLRRTVSIIVIGFFMNMMKASRHTLACMLTNQTGLLYLIATLYNKEGWNAAVTFSC